MAEQIQQDGQKTIVAFVVGLLIGGLLVWAFSGPGTNQEDPMAPTETETATETEADMDTDEMAETPTETAPTTPVVTTLPVGDGSVTVSDQPAALTVALEEAVFPVGEGWIGVRNYQNGQLGTILGVVRFSESQGLVPSNIILQTPTISGREYAVVVFSEDGDFAFNTAADVQIDTIFATFTAK